MPSDSLVFMGTLDYDDYCSFRVVVDAAGIKGSLSFFGYADTFQTFGQQLLNFPTDTQEVVSFEQGEDTSSRQEYLLLKAYYLDRAGHTALRVVMDNKAPTPLEKRVAFSLVADVSSLIELGRKLVSWQLQPGPASIIKWHPLVS